LEQSTNQIPLLVYYNDTDTDGLVSRASSGPVHSDENDDDDDQCAT